MAAGINVVAVSGNLTKDPELRSLPTGTSICNMRLAVNAREKSNGEWQDRANYFNVTVWGAHGENCAKYLQRGSGVMVQGRLRWREWEGNDGSKRQDVEIVADQVVFMPRGDGGQGGGGGQGQQSMGGGGGGSYGVPSSAPAAPTSAPIQDDDDIPF
jgi:single-strand DNA-binding protein